MNDNSMLTIAKYEFVLFRVQNLLVLGIVLHGLTEQLNKCIEEVDVGPLRGECLPDELISCATRFELRAFQERVKLLPNGVRPQL